MALAKRSPKPAVDLTSGWLGSSETGRRCSRSHSKSGSLAHASVAAVRVAEKAEHARAALLADALANGTVPAYIDARKITVRVVDFVIRVGAVEAREIVGGEDGGHAAREEEVAPVGAAGPGQLVEDHLTGRRLGVLVKCLAAILSCFESFFRCFE